MDNLEDFKEIYNKNNLKISCKYEGGSVLDKKNYIVKSLYSLPKTKFDKNISISYVNDIIYVPEMRTKWDETLKVLKDQRH